MSPNPAGGVFRPDRRAGSDRDLWEAGNPATRFRGDLRGGRCRGSRVSGEGSHWYVCFMTLLQASSTAGTVRRCCSSGESRTSHSCPTIALTMERSPGFGDIVIAIIRNTTRAGARPSGRVDDPVRRIRRSLWQEDDEDSKGRDSDYSVLSAPVYAGMLKSEGTRINNRSALRLPHL
jgi:hypothetical protein